MIIIKYTSKIIHLILWKCLSHYAKISCFFIIMFLYYHISFKSCLILNGNNHQHKLSRIMKVIYSLKLCVLNLQGKTSHIQQSTNKNYKINQNVRIYDKKEKYIYLFVRFFRKMYVFFKKFTVVYGFVQLKKHKNCMVCTCFFVKMFGFV